jgi:hypothetical protein
MLVVKKPPLKQQKCSSMATGVLRVSAYYMLVAYGMPDTLLNKYSTSHVSCAASKPITQADAVTLL